MAQRDYILRLIEQVGQFLRRAIRQREGHQPKDALQSVMAACERLFGMEAVQLFQFTPDQHFEMLANDDALDSARDKILIYASLNAEAGECYRSTGQPALSRQSFINALRLTLKARKQFSADDWPEFAPDIDGLVKLLSDAPLDDDTNALIADAARAARS